MDARNTTTPDMRDQIDSERAHRRGRRSALLRIALLLSLVVAGVAAIAIWPQRTRELIAQAAALLYDAKERETAEDEAAEAKPASGLREFKPSAEQRNAFAIKPVETMLFRPEGSAEGRIALNDDDNVPVTSPYAGRVNKVLVRAGDRVKANQVLLTMEATDMVQAQNDYQAALNTLHKTQALLKLNQTIAARQQELFQARATALKDYQSAQNDVIAAQSDLGTAEASLQAVKNRLRLLGKTDAEIVQFERNGTLSSETEIRAPIAGTIVQRKVGVGQYISSNSDPVFVIGDLSTVWLIANVRESEVPRIKIGQVVEARVVGLPRLTFKAKVDYMAASLDPATRRLAVRSEVENPDRLLKPEMFASFTIVTGDDRASPGVPSAAVVYEGERAHVWVARPDGAVEARDVKLGLTNGDFVQVVEGLKPGESIVTRGALFIDRAASGEKAS